MNGKKITAIMLTMGMALGMTTAALPVNAEEERPEVRVLIKWAESQLSNWTDLVDEYNADESNPVTINLEFYGSEGYDDKVKGRAYWR